MADWMYGTAGLQPLKVEWPDIDDHDQCLQALGYGARTMRFGECDGCSEGVEVEVRERIQDGAPGAYLVAVEVGSTIEEVHVQDFPGLLSFLRDLAPLMHLTFKSNERDELRNHLYGCGTNRRPDRYCPHCRNEEALSGRNVSEW